MSKVRFYISSTFEDLKEHRSILLNSFAALKQEVEAMEYWGPDSQSSLDLCLEHIRSSDIYIGIFGTKYGFEPDNKKSITQYEYEEATKLGKKRLVYFIDEEHHRIVYKNVDIGEKGLKLNEFKSSIERSIVRAKFSSPQDLTTKIITHCIQYLDSIGHNIQIINNQNKIIAFHVGGAYDIGATPHALDASPYLKFENDGKITFNNILLQKVLFGGIIANQLKEEDYSGLDGIATFDQITWNIISCLVKLKPINLTKFKQVLSSESNPFKIRLLISLAGEMENSNLLDSVCKKTLINLHIDSYFKNNSIHVTSLYDTAKRAIIAISTLESQTLIESYILKATQQKNWKAKKLFESVLISLRNLVIK